MSVRRWFASLISLLCLVSCLQTSPKLVKIGLVAPFEGHYREIGVDVIPAARLAIREWASQHPNADIAIELVAYDDAGESDQAVEQAHKLTADPDVAVVIGHWRDNTSKAALPVYADAGLPMITFTTTDSNSSGILYNFAPSRSALKAAVANWAADSDLTLSLSSAENTISDAATLSPNQIGDETWGLSQFYNLAPDSVQNAYFASPYAMPTDFADNLSGDNRTDEFIEGFEQGSLGAPPGFFSALAYEATWSALDWIAVQYGISTSAPMKDALRFGENGRRFEPPIYIYRWEAGHRQFLSVQQ